MSNKKSLPWRILYYSRLGLGLVNLPIALLGLVSLVYYQFIINIPMLHAFFPRFWMFGVIGFISACALSVMVGYMFRKRSKGFIEQRNVDVETDPYQKEKVVPVVVPFWEAMVELLEKHDVDCRELKRILARSGSKKYTEDDHA